METTVTNTTSETFAVISAAFFENNCQWIPGEEAKIGETLKAGGSVTWGVLTTSPNGTAEALIRLKGSKGSLIGVEMKNLYDGIACILVELAPSITYSVQTSATGLQASCKVVISSGS